MKKLLLLIIIVFCMSSTALAFQDEPTGFRGLPWGSSVKTFMDKYPTCKKVDSFDDSLRPVERYQVSVQNDSISGVPITKPINYFFWNNKLMRISITLTGDSDETSTNNAFKMRRALMTLYGPGEEIHIGGLMDSYIWDGTVSKISFHISYRDLSKTTSSRSFITINSKKIRAEYMNYLEELEKKEAKQGW